MPFIRCRLVLAMLLHMAVAKCGSCAIRRPTLIGCRSLPLTNHSVRCLPTTASHEVIAHTTHPFDAGRRSRRRELLMTAMCVGWVFRSFLSLTQLVHKPFPSLNDVLNCISSRLPLTLPPIKSFIMPTFFLDYTNCLLTCVYLCVNAVYLVVFD